MKLLLVVDNHLYQTPDGRVWSKGIYDYTFFSRYLDGFKTVNVAIRIKKIEQPSQDYPNLCSGKNVYFLPLPDFYGVKGYLKNFFKMKSLIKQYIKECDCTIIRIPSAIGFQFASKVKRKMPYALEVVVDPWDFAAPKMLTTKFRPMIRVVWTYKLKQLCRDANGVSYVTKYALQKRYPSKAHIEQLSSKEYFTTHYSSANIKEDFFMKRKSYPEKIHELQIIHVANAINSYVKGHKELIDVVKILKDKNQKVFVKFVGDGDFVSIFRNYAEKLDVQDQIKFIGRIPSKDLMRKTLRESDLFVFPTHGEGLPRVLIEAMAVGVPCLSTNVNGIPELLPKELIVDVGDIEAMADKIENLINNTDRLNKESEKAVAKAMEYREDVLQIRRKEFYTQLSNLAINRG